VGNCEQPPLREELNMPKERKRMINQQTKAYLLGGAAVLLWSTVASAFTMTLRHTEPLQLVFLASVCSTLALLSALVVQRKLHLVIGYPKKQLPYCLLLGILNPCLYYTVLLEAYKRLPAQEALSINYSWPVMLVLFSILFLKQRVRLVELGAICIAYFGVLFIATQGQLLSLNFDNPLGMGLALASTVIWAGFWISNMRHRQDITATLFLSFVLVTPLLGILTFILMPIRQMDGAALGGAAYIGVFEMGITYLLWLTALKTSTNTVKVSSLAFATPFLSLMVLTMLVGEKITEATLIGLVFIVTGIALQSFLRN